MHFARGMEWGNNNVPILKFRRQKLPRSRRDVMRKGEQIRLFNRWKVLF